MVVKIYSTRFYYDRCSGFYCLRIHNHSVITKMRKCTEGHRANLKGVSTWSRYVSDFIIETTCHSFFFLLLFRFFFFFKCILTLHTLPIIVFNFLPSIVFAGFSHCAVKTTRRVRYKDGQFVFTPSGVLRVTFRIFSTNVTKK